MMKFKNPFRSKAPRIMLKRTKKGIVADFTDMANAEAMMQLVYVMCSKLAQAYGVDFRYFVKQILKVDTQHTKRLKEQADPRPYKKTKNQK